MTQESKQPVPDEIAVLLSEAEVGGYKIRPWSFGRFKKVYPVLAGVVPALRGLDLDLTTKNTQEVLQARAGEIIEAILPSLTPLIARTLDISKEEVDAWDFDQVAAIGLTIIIQNLGRIKNSLPLIMAQLQAVIRAA